MTTTQMILMNQNRNARRGQTGKVTNADVRDIACLVLGVISLLTIVFFMVSVL